MRFGTVSINQVTNYHRWVFENCKEESVELLREWVIQEADFPARAQFGDRARLNHNSRG